MAVEPQVQQFIDFIRDEMPRRIKTNPNSLPDAEKLLVSVSGTLEVIYKTLAELDIAKKSDLVKDILTLLDQVADQTLVANTTYEIGEYTNTLNLLMPDPVPGGTTVTLAVPMILAAPVGDITVVFPTGKELFGVVPSIPLKATLDPLPGDRIVFTYSSNASKWVFYKTQSLYQKRLYLVGTSSSNPTLDPHIYHSFISNATTNRSISIPDTDIDLSAVGQTEFFTSEFVLKDPTTPPTKEIGFNASQISGGQTRIISMPDADVDLGDMAKVSNQRYQFLNDGTTTGTTYTVPASAVTATGRTIIELSNNSLTSITINTATGTDKVAGDSVNISITGTYAAQELFGSGVTLEGDLTFSYQYETKTLIYKGSDTWKVVG